MRKIYIVCSLMCLAGWLGAQSDWTATLELPTTFIENRGQYDFLREGFPEAPRYVLDHGFGWQVGICDGGLQYLVQRTVHEEDGPSLLAADLEEEEGELDLGEVRSSHVRVNFEHALPGRRLVAEGLQPDYYTYGPEASTGTQDLSNVPSFAHLRYQGLYQGIDATVTAENRDNLRYLKYAFEVAPGADPSQIGLRWTGSVPRLDGNGDLHLEVVLGEIVDLAPTAWYADDPTTLIPVRFVLQGEVVGFELGSYDANRAIIIDPWTVNPALPAPFNRAFEVDADNAGNVYVFGGGMGYNLKKYNAAGTLQWTHVSPWDTSNSWFGELLVLGAGDVFITSGSAAKIRRLTTAGATTFTNNGPFFNVDEYWTLTLNCDNTKLISGGSRIISLTSPQGHVFDLNMANGNQMAGSPYNVSPVGMKEIRALCVGGNGNYYLLSNDNLISLNQTFGIVYSIASGTSHPYYSPQYMAQSVQGQNIIDANSSDIYVARGTNVERRAIATGAITTTVAIPGGGFTGGFLGSGAANGGLVLDDCGNVYVGSTNQVLKYSAALAQLATVATTGAVYDVDVAPGNVVIWGGNGFLTSNTSFTPCAPKTVTCVILPAELGPMNIACNQGRVSLQWRSLQEHNLSHYAVQRSSDGLTWETRQQVPANGDSDQPLSYSFDEPEPTGNSQGTWYYRLEMMDRDGMATNSPLVLLEPCDGAGNAMILPNLVQSTAHLSFVSATEGNGTLSLVNSLGQEVKAWEGNWEAGANSIALPVANLPRGVYHVQVRASNGAIKVRNAMFVRI